MVPLRVPAWLRPWPVVTDTRPEARLTRGAVADSIPLAPWSDDLLGRRRAGRSPVRRLTLMRSTLIIGALRLARLRAFNAGTLTSEEWQEIR